MRRPLKQNLGQLAPDSTRILCYNRKTEIAKETITLRVPVTCLETTRLGVLFEREFDVGLDAFQVLMHLL